MNFAILNQTLSLKPLFSQYLRKGNLEPENLLVLKIFLQRCWIKFAKLVGGVTLQCLYCLSRVATQAGCKSFASLPLRKFSICHQFRSNQRPQSGVRTLFNVPLEFLNSRLSGNSGAIGEEAMEAKRFEIKGVHGVEQPRSKWQDVRLLHFFRIFCLSHPSDRDYTLSTLKRQESKFLTFMKKFSCCQLEKWQGLSIAQLLEKMEVVWNKILIDLQKRSEDLTFREMKFAGVLQLRPSEVGWFEEGKQKFAVSAVCRRKCRGASTLETDLGFQLRLRFKF